VGAEDTILQLATTHRFPDLSLANLPCLPIGTFYGSLETNLHGAASFSHQYFHLTLCSPSDSSARHRDNHFPARSQSANRLAPRDTGLGGGCPCGWLPGCLLPADESDPKEWPTLNSHTHSRDSAERWPDIGVVSLCWCRRHWLQLAPAGAVLEPDPREWGFPGNQVSMMKDSPKGSSYDMPANPTNSESRIVGRSVSV
jgi:hypothetical protein